MLKRPIHEIFLGRPLFILAGFLMILASLSACVQSNTNSPSPSTQGPIKIGASLPLSGDLSQDGTYTKNGYLLWQDYVNSHGGLLGRQVQMDILNNGSKVEQTGTDYTTLIGTNHDQLVIGPFADDYTVSAARAAARYNYAMVNGTGVAPTVFSSGLKNLFSVSLPAATTLSSFSLYVQSLPASMRPKTAAYATNDDPYLRPIVETVKAKLESGGITSLTGAQPIVYPPETTDWTPIADKIIATHAQIVIVGTNIADAVAFVKRFKQEHFNPQMLVEVSGPDQGSQFSDAIGGTKEAEGIFVPNGSWYPGIKNFGEADFEQAYTKKYGGTPDGISQDAVQGWSALQVLQQAVEKNKSLDNAKLMDTLRNNTFQTLQGAVKFASDGSNSIATPFLYQWQSGSTIPVYPSNDAQKNPIFPKPNWQ